MKHAGIVVNQDKSGAVKLLQTLRVWFDQKKIPVSDSVSKPIESWPAELDLVICLGGDGTLLKTITLLESRPVPVLGVNLGSLGFLTEIKQEEVFEELERFIAGASEIEERLKLKCVLESGEKKIRQEFIALNDVVISREGLTRMLRLSVCVNDERLTSFAGDGVILASPTGSTAYSLSAGGAVVYPTLEALLITPICPHASSLRPMVVSSHEKINVNMIKGIKGARAAVTIDGQIDVEIDDTFTVQVTRDAVAVKLIKSSRRGYFESLRENFRFP